MSCTYFFIPPKMCISRPYRMYISLAVGYKSLVEQPTIDVPTAYFEPKKELKRQTFFIHIKEILCNILVGTTCLASIDIWLIIIHYCYSRILCKIVRTSPPITVFFSSYTMAFIAIDRHRFIVHSAKRQVQSLLKIYLLKEV